MYTVNLQTLKGGLEERWHSLPPETAQCHLQDCCLLWFSWRTLHCVVPCQTHRYKQLQHLYQYIHSTCTHAVLSYNQWFKSLDSFTHNSWSANGLGNGALPCGQRWVIWSNGRHVQYPDWNTLHVLYQVISYLETASLYYGHVTASC